MAGILRLSNTGTGNGQSTITSAASGDTTYTLPSGGGTFVTTASTQSLTVPFASGTAALPGLTPVGDPNTGIYSPGADQLALSTSGTGRLFVDASGNVGVGLGSPQVPLHVKGADTGTDSSLLRLQTPGASNLYFRYKDGSDDNSNWELYTGGSEDLIFSPGANERLRITSAGLVGIGTSSPGNELVVNNSALGANTKLEIKQSGGGGGTSEILFSDSVEGRGRIYFDHGSSPEGIKFAIAGSDALIIDTSQRVGIGTTSPSYQLQLSTDSAGKPSTNTWTIVSDERIKEEIELADLDLCYEAVKNIPLKRFKWKDEVYTEEQAYDRRKLGWIAQDVETVFPKAVRQHEFKYNQVFEEVVIPAVPAELDDDGNIITEEQPERIEKGKLISEEVIEDCRDLNSDQIYAAMYGAIQKLISKVELLEAEVQALKG